MIQSAVNRSLRSAVWLCTLAIPCYLPAQGPALPEIGAVVGLADTRSGAGIPRGGLFTIYGVNLASSTANAAGFPLPAVMNGVRVEVCCDASQKSFDALPVYVSPGLINALMPSTVPEGTAYQVTVVTGAVQSVPAPINVITSRFAAFTESWLGYGPPVLVQYEGPGHLPPNRFLHPARPEQAMVVWGTGLGPLPVGAFDAKAPPVANIRDDVVVYVAGIPVKPFYAGRTPGTAGVDQINFFLPKNVPVGCMVPFVVRAAGNDTGPLTMAISKDSSACTSEFGLSNTALGRLDQAGTVRAAVLNFGSKTGAGSSSPVQQTSEAWIADYTAAALSVLAGTDFPTAAIGDGCQARSFSYQYRPTPTGPDYHGDRIDEPRAHLNIAITGSTGSTACSWTGLGDGCLASTFNLNGSAGISPPFSVTGSLPAPLAASAIGNFVVQQAGGTWHAVWQAGGAMADERLILDVKSSFTLSGGGFFFTETDVRELACRTPARGGLFAFPQPDISNALALPSQQVTLDWTQAADQVIVPTQPNSVDFVLIRTRNTIEAVAPN